MKASNCEAMCLACRAILRPLNGHQFGLATSSSLTPPAGACVQPCTPHKQISSNGSEHNTFFQPTFSVARSLPWWDLQCMPDSEPSQADGSLRRSKPVSIIKHLIGGWFYWRKWVRKHRMNIKHLCFVIVQCPMWPQHPLQRFWVYMIQDLKHWQGEHDAKAAVSALLSLLAYMNMYLHVCRFVQTSLCIFM